MRMPSRPRRNTGWTLPWIVNILGMTLRRLPSLLRDLLSVVSRPSSVVCHLFSVRCLELNRKSSYNLLSVPGVRSKAYDGGQFLAYEDWR